jgi:hypothetical protein
MAALMPSAGRLIYKLQQFVRRGDQRFCPRAHSNARTSCREEIYMVRNILIAAASAAVLTLSPTAFAQQPSQYGSAAEAKAMLLKAVAAVKADKAKALDMFNKGEGGFLDRDRIHFALMSATA